MELYTDDEIIAVFEQEGSQRKVARRFGIAQSTLNDYLQRPGKEELRTACLVKGASKSDASAAGYAMYYPPEATITGASPDVEVDIGAIKTSAIRRFELKARRAREKRNQEIRFPHGPVCLFLVGDQHLGNEGTDVGRVFHEQELMLSTPGGFVWQLGDGVDSFVIGKLVKENWHPSLSVWEQWALYQHYMRSFGDRLVAYNAGNHEGFMKKVSGIDYSREICPQGILYDADQICCNVMVGGISYKLFSRHKYKNSSQYNQTHGQEWWARFQNSTYDVYIGAHRHTGAVTREFVLGENRKLAIQTGTYKVEDSFAREKGFGEHDCSTACALILNQTGTFWATSNLEGAREYMEAVY